MGNNQGAKVLIFSMTYLPFIGGAELAVKEITDRLNNFSFDLITARLDRKLAKFERIGNINVYRVGYGWFLDKYLFPCLAYFKAVKLHQQNNYQVVQAIMAFYAGLAALFFKWRYKKVKYLLTMQSGDSDLFIWLRTWFWYPIYKKIYTNADYIQAISRFLEKRAIKYGYKGKVEIVPNGVDIERFANNNGRAKELRRKLGIKENEKVVITVSRLVMKNGIDDLIKAGKYLDFTFKILIIGKGKDEKKLKKMTQSLGLENKVIFLEQIIHKDLPQYLFLSHIFVRPSLSEGLGSAFLEAMAAGLPVVATPVGGIPDFLKDPSENLEEATGVFCRISDPKSAAEKIKLLVENNQLREKIIKNGKEMVSKDYNWQMVSKKMENIFNKLCAS